VNGKPPEALGAVARRAARNAAAMAVSEVVGKIATLALTIAAARALGVSEFGAFAYAISLSLLIATLPTWGFDLDIIQRGSADPASLPQTVAQALTWQTAIAVPVFLGAGVVGVAGRPDAESAVALILILAAVMIDVYSGIGYASATAKQELAGVSAVQAGQRFVAAGLGIAALVMGVGLIGVAAAYLVASLIALVGTWWIVLRLGVVPDRRGVTRSGLWNSFRRSSAMGVDGVVGLLLFRGDQLLLETLKGDAAVGAYAAAYRLVETVLFISWAVAGAALPAMSEDTGRIRRGSEQGLAAVAALYLPFAVALWIEPVEILRLLFGPEYAREAAGAVRWLAPVPMLFAIAFVAGQGLLAIGRPWRAVATTVVAALLNIVLNLVLIPDHSGTGAAAATTVAYVVKGAFVLLALVPFAGWIRAHRSIAIPLVASAPFAVMLLLLHIPIVVELVMSGIIYATCWYLLTRRLAPEQITLAKEVLRRRRAYSVPAVKPPEEPA